jgi:glyoxylase-like metal-dependent hydrolase (beta-lactamase superfamily II)
MLTRLLACALLLTQTAPGRPAPPIARELAPDIHLLAGAVPDDRGPDGNTVIITAPAGLVVIDTGRHPWHSDGIVDFARHQKRPVSVIVNTHWHLDHSSGNRRVKAEHPQAKVYTTRAVERALAPDGFLTRNLKAQRAQPMDATMSAARKEAADLFFATMDASESLRPDVAVEQSGTLSLAGRRLATHVAANAVTDADLWLYDEKSGIVVIGDLVTLPAPFFETACPARWQEALDQVRRVPFRLAVPGHGEPMTRDQFDIYRGAFGRFRACVASDDAPAACAGGWRKDVDPLLTNAAARRQAVEYATYYVGFLRKNGGASPDCLVK